jgi:FeS assembly SUF system protein
MNKEHVKDSVIEQMKTVFDPEIPSSIWELGLIYDIEISETNEGVVDITMTLTSPGCPVADQLLQEVKDKAELVPEVELANVNLVFEPEWNPDLMSEEAKLELGFL